MASIEASSSNPLTVANGTFAAKAPFVFAADYVQRYQLAMVTTAEYIIKIESSGDVNYADLALFARMVGANPAYWAQQAAWLIAPLMTLSSTDQDILDRIWTIWPVLAYKASTVLYPTTGP